MKHTLFLFLAAFSFSAYSNPLPPASYSMCGDRYCTNDMLQIYDGFMNTTAPLPKESQAFSGNCFHIHPNLRPEVVHHGLMLVERHESGEMTFSGLFSFFTTQNPYGGKTLEELQDFMNGRSARKHPVSFLNEPTGEEGYVEIPSSNGSNYYWFKVDGKKAYLMSLWDHLDPRTDVRIYCELNEKAGS